jgi:molybdate transport system substrate-binding protein
VRFNSRLFVVLAAHILFIGTIIASVQPSSVYAGEVRVAVAANFADTAKEIGELFEAASEHTTVLSVGSTGQIYAQISQGAPFDVFMAADQTRPIRTELEGYAVSGTRFTYAVGRLVLFSADTNSVRGKATLTDGVFNKLAIANPVTAPYGAAALDVMKALGVHASLEGKLVRGNTIAQTYQFVASGNAELGFVALSQVNRHREGSRWIVPEFLHARIAQDAVLLTPGKNRDAARAFMVFLKGPAARAVIEKFGYGAAKSP